MDALNERQLGQTRYVMEFSLEQLQERSRMPRLARINRRLRSIKVSQICHFQRIADIWRLTEGRYVLTPTI